MMVEQALNEHWREILELEHRQAPELFVRGSQVIGTPYADAIRKAFAELDVTAVFCVQGVPTVAILNQDPYRQDEVVRVHAALWNQGLASVLVVVSADTVRVFSLAKAPGAGGAEQFEKRCLIEAMDAASAALSLSGYITGAESGRLWHERADYFDPKERIDAVLLNNLTVAHDLLIQEKLTSAEAQAILIQTMFIAYLEDRQITRQDYFETASEGNQTSFHQLLSSGHTDGIERLFQQLQNDFNGDLFVAPCSFDEKEKPHRLTGHAMDVLLRFRDGRKKMSEDGGQARFWGYDFRYIPVELISAVYDRFLGEDDDARRDAGAYYTPMFLVDTVVASVWETIDDKVKSAGVFLDPACGSGIFLVRCFQRMCEHWRANSKQSTIRWDSLLRMMNRVQGRDLNGGAARVAVFSLYIALLEEVTPPDIRKLVAKGRLLPTLWNNTIVRRDFFEESEDELKADVIIGNPPWTSRRSQNSSGVAWSQKRRFPVPSKEEAWAFTWKSICHLNEGGLTAFLLPAMGFLHNHARLSVEARQRLFKDTQVTRVINFSDLRRQLFDGAISPTALIVFKQHEMPHQPYMFEYWAPKADLNLSIKRFVSLSSVDKSKLHSSDVTRNPLLFKQRLWMRAPELKLFNYLAALPRLNGFIQEYGSLKKQRKDVNSGWVMGQGFQPYYGNSNANPTSGPYESKFVGNIPHLPVEAFTSIAVRPDQSTVFAAGMVRRKGFERGFSGPRVLIPQGVHTSRMRLRAAYSNSRFTFQDSLQAIVAPQGFERRLKLICALLNSRLAVWFSFHGTGSFGSGRPKVHQSDLLTLPCPSPNDLGDPEKAKQAEEKIVDLIDETMELRKQPLIPSDFEDSVLQAIDQHIYDYFGLSDDEITLIEDGLDFFIPASQPTAGGKIPKLWHEAVIRDRRRFAEKLSAGLEDWFANDHSVCVSLAARNKDSALLKLTLRNEPQCPDYSEDLTGSFSDALDRLSNAVGESVISNFQTIPDMRIFVGNSLYLVKPLQLRFWLPSSALADADSIASDLQTLVATQKHEGTGV